MGGRVRSERVRSRVKRRMKRRKSRMRRWGRKRCRRIVLNLMPQGG